MAYQSRTNEFGQQIIAIATQVRAQYPTDWQNAHNHQASGEVYIRRVAWAVHQALPTLGVGLNGKRGNINDLSQDVLAFRNDSGCRNACSGGGLELRDIIVSAGSPQASLYYGDVTQATIDKNEAGCWIAPAAVDGGQPVPIPPTPVEPSFPYPDENTTVKAFQDRVKKAYNDAGRLFPDPNDSDAFRRFTRYGYDCRTHPEPATADKHIKELRAELGVP